MIEQPLGEAPYHIQHHASVSIRCSLRVDTDTRLLRHHKTKDIRSEFTHWGLSFSVYFSRFPLSVCMSVRLPVWLSVCSPASLVISLLVCLSVSTFGKVASCLAVCPSLALYLRICVRKPWIQYIGILIYKKQALHCIPSNVTKLNYANEIKRGKCICPLKTVIELTF